MQPVSTEEVEPDRGPVMVTMEYVVDPANAADFRREMLALREIRRRDGAYFWDLFQDTADPSRFVESFMVESWVEHLRQHERVTVADREVEQAARAFHIGLTPPTITHFLYARAAAPRR